MKYIKGLASLAVLLVVVIGIPAALILVAGNPLPSAETVSRLLTTPDYGGRFLFGTFLPLVAWIAWLTFTVSVAVEIPPALSGMRPRRIRGLGAQQALAGALIGTIVFMFTAGSLAGAPTAQATPELKAATQFSAPYVIETHATPEAEQKAEPASALPKHTVAAGESLWKLAEQYLGDASQSVTHVVAAGESLSSIAQQYYGEPDAYDAIFQASSSTVQPDGRQLTDPSLIAPGWVVMVPSQVEQAPAAAASKTGNTWVPEVTDNADEGDIPPAEAGRQVAPQAPAALEENLPASPAEPELAVPESAVAPSPVPGTVSSSPVSESAETAAGEDAESVDVEFPTRTIGGIGSILAAGILSILGLKRIGQRRQRKAGERVAVPSREEENIELQLRAVKDPMTIDDLDHALKYLAVWGQNESKSCRRCSVFVWLRTKLPSISRPQPCCQRHLYRPTRATPCGRWSPETLARWSGYLRRHIPLWSPLDRTRRTRTCSLTSNTSGRSGSQGKRSSSPTL